jgi:hypothetical protein
MIYVNTGKGEQRISLEDLLKNSFCFKSVRFNLLCYWDFQHYKPAILGDKEEDQIVDRIMSKMNLKKGSDL